jgi:hypothetical protein
MKFKTTVRDEMPDGEDYPLTEQDLASHFEALMPETSVALQFERYANTSDVVLGA